MEPKVSIITVNFNGRKFLADFFRSLQDLRYGNFELIFSDNGSHDGSVAYVREQGGHGKIIENRRNLGFSVANNIAAETASGEYLFFLNNDTKVHPEAVSELVKIMEADTGIGICGCKMMSYDGSKHFHTGIGIDVLGFPTVHKGIFYAEGSALMIRKRLFLEMGGFDPEYFMFHEDIDLAWRVWLAGYRVTAIPEAVIYHSVGASAGGAAIKKDELYKSTFFRRYLSERNNIRTLLKNYSFQSLVMVFPWYVLINIMEIFLFIIILKPKVAFCYLRAYFWNLKSLKNTMFYRRIVQRGRKVSDMHMFAKMYFGIGKYAVFRIVRIPSFE